MLSNASKWVGKGKEGKENHETKSRKKYEDSINPVMQS